jgi:hypothetical protein
VNLKLMYFCRMCRYVFVKDKNIYERVFSELCPLCQFPGVEAQRNNDEEIAAIAEGKPMSDTGELNEEDMGPPVQDRRAMALVRARAARAANIAARKKAADAAL